MDLPSPRLARVSPSHRPMLGRDPAFVRCIRALERFAPLPHAALVRGETGTGKELAARLLHERSGRAGAFVAINCGAIPEQLAESELFGHVRGAFTGASRNVEGAFQRAAGGTLFLDEVGELPRQLQPKLLRALETGCVTVVGGGEIEVEVRVVSATHQDLEGMIAQGRFREDLFHRLSILEVEMVPLRRRRRDIPILLDHFVTQATKETGRPVELSPAARKAAFEHDWPGNVRALRNAVVRASALSEGPIGPEDLIPKRGALGRGGGLIVPRGNYQTMTRELLLQVVAEEGSIRKAAQVLAVPRSTLGAWLKRGEQLAPPSATGTC